MKNKRGISASALKNIAISTLIILFFLGVIVAYYVMLTSETRQRIIKSSELIAAASSQEINTYLSDGIYAMRLTCHTLDNMIRDGRSKYEIMDFIVNQSIAIENITSGKSTGLYAFINGEYFDGSGGRPGPGDAHTERPWYVGARANIGRVAVSEPYLDAHAKTTMTTLSKTLCDAKSVAAMDFSLDRLQSITEELAARNESVMEIVLDRKYQVIAHSDKAELGKSYLGEEGSFGQVLVNALRQHDDSHFSFSFGGADYIAYKVRVANDWLCLSVFDATSVFRHLRILLIFTIVTSVLVVSVLSLLMGYSNRKARLARELQLNEKAERAAAANEAKSSFLASMSHEIRTPINAVLGMNEMIIRTSRDKQVTTYARNVESAGKNLLSIINDILDFSKIEAGKMEIAETDYKFSSLLNDVTNMILFKAKQKGLEFRVDVDEALPDGLHGDPVRVRQVAVNILNNAVKYTDQGSVSFRVGGGRDGDRVNLEFAVKDTGIGIKPEDLPKLFGKFQRVDLAHNSTVEGTGLGLSITKNLLELMGGAVSVESEYGKGSTFTIRLPQRVVSGEPIGDFKKRFEEYVHSLRAYHESFRAPDARILVVDDTDMNLTVVGGLLSKTEVRIDTASSGMEALGLTEKAKYDLILMDHRMPQMNGSEALARIRAQEKGLNRQTPVICLTADAVSGARARYIAEGFTDYLSKPIEGSNLEAALIKYLPAEKVALQDEAEPGDAAAAEMTELEAFYASVPALNYGDALRFCSNEEVLRKTLEQFYHSIKPNANAIDGFLMEKDYKNYTIKVHALKSSARLIGAEALSADARYLEDLGNSLSGDDVRRIGELTPKLLEDYRKLHELLSPLYAEEAAARESAPEISTDELNEAYEAIRQFISGFDIDAIDGFVSEVRKYRLPRLEEAKFALVEECVRNMDWIGLEEALRG